MTTDQAGVLRCRAPGCNGERRFAVAELANFYGKDRTVGEILTIY
jgi:hypothetical protein